MKFIPNLMQFLQKNKFTSKQEPIEEEESTETVECSKCIESDAVPDEIFNAEQTRPALEWDEDEDDFTPTITPAASLPDGWFWRDFNDGSGGLQSPDRKTHFDYDLHTCYGYIGGIEYKDRQDGEWDVFFGCLSEFKEFAEEQIAKTSQLLGY